MDDEYRFEAELWRWTSQKGGAAWFFVTMPADAAADLRMEAGPPTGFGSIRIEATVGASTWQTSVFPSQEAGGFLLPMKKAIRTAEDLEEGDPCVVTLRVVRR